MLGLAPHTSNIIEKVSKLECLKPFVLVGGTALSLQLGTRDSEDLDFMRWRTSNNDKLDVGWHEIEKALSAIGEVSSTNLMDFNHVEFVFDGVKLSFYASDNYSPLQKTIPFINNIVLADIISIGAMKMEVMLRRSNFRDYYDIYSILKTGVKIENLIELALKYSRHRLKSKNLTALLCNGSRFHRDMEFEQLNPKYTIQPSEIESYIKSLFSNLPSK